MQKLFLAITTAAFIISCSTVPPEPLRVNASTWIGCEPFFLARELGYYDNKPIELIETTFVQDQHRAFLNDEFDMLCTSLDATLELIDNKADTRVFLVLDVSHGADALVVQAEIENIADLKGKTIGIPPFPLARLLLTRALETADLSIEDVELVDLEIVDQEAPFQSKEIDAAVTFEPARSSLIASGAKLLFDSSQVPGEIVDVLIGSQSLGSTHAQQIKILLDGWFKALDEIEKNPKESIELMAKREGISPDQFEQALQGLQLIGLKDNQAIFDRTDTDFIEGMRRLSVFLEKTEIIQNEIDPITIFEEKPLNEF